MREIIILLTALMISFTACAEGKRKLENGIFKIEKTEVQSQDTETPYKWEVKQDGQVVNLPIYITKRGKCYIIRTSKEGKQYRQYLPKEQTEQIQKFVGYEGNAD